MFKTDNLYAIRQICQIVAAIILKLILHSSIDADFLVNKALDNALGLSNTQTCS